MNQALGHRIPFDEIPLCVELGVDAGEWVRVRSAGVSVDELRIELPKIAPVCRDSYLRARSVASLDETLEVHSGDCG